MELYGLMELHDFFDKTPEGRKLTHNLLSGKYLDNKTITDENGNEYRYKCLVKGCNRYPICSHVFARAQLEAAFPKNSIVSKFYSHSYWSKSASKTFNIPLFCCRHDNDIFAPIEKGNTYNPENIQQTYLYLYRCLAFIIHALYLQEHGELMKDSIQTKKATEKALLIYNQIFNRLWKNISSHYNAQKWFNNHIYIYQVNEKDVGEPLFFLDMNKFFISFAFTENEKIYILNYFYDSDDKNTFEKITNKWEQKDINRLFLYINLSGMLSAINKDNILSDGKFAESHIMQSEMVNQDSYNLEIYLNTVYKCFCERKIL